MEVVWIVDRLFVPRRLDFGEIAVVPLSVELDSMGAALRAYLVEAGGPLGGNPSPARPVDMVAVVFRDMNLGDPEEALTATKGTARAVASALGFRQRGRGSLVGAVARADGVMTVRRLPYGYPQVTNLPFVPEVQEVVALIRSFQDHPQAIVLADLFAEGCRDQNPSAGVARLWAVLEAIAEKFPGNKLGKVRGALRQLQIGEPEFGGEPLLKREWDVRNDLMHRGILAPDDTAGNLREELAHLTKFTLRHAGLAPVIPIEKGSRPKG